MPLILTRIGGCGTHPKIASKRGKPSLGDCRFVRISASVWPFTIFIAK